jgi:multiple sugar transport system ATP-binding protein
VFQNYSLYPHMTVEQNIAFPLRIAGMPKPERHQKAAKAAKLLGLENRLHAKPAELSGGQRQRVALGRAIVREPALFLLDEPLSNLDTELRLRMRTEIVRLQKSLGRPAVHVTHDQSEAMAMADRIALMKDGRIVQLGTPEQLYNEPTTLFAATFLGHPRINIIRSHWENGQLHPLNISIPAGNSPRKDGELLLAVRPQNIRLEVNGAIPAEVVASEYVGEGHHVTLNAMNTSLVASVHTQPPAIGEKVRISFDSNAIKFFDPASGNRIV